MSNYDYKCSLPAYKEPKDQSRQKVFSAIQKLQPCTNQQISEYLGWEINRITGRVKELREKNLVQCAKKDKDTVSGRLVNYWETVKWQLNFNF